MQESRATSSRAKLSAAVAPGSGTAAAASSSSRRGHFQTTGVPNEELLATRENVAALTSPLGFGQYGDELCYRLIDGTAAPRELVNRKGGESKSIVRTAASYRKWAASQHQPKPPLKKFQQLLKLFRDFEGRPELMAAFLKRYAVAEVLELDDEEMGGADGAREGLPLLHQQKAPARQPRFYYHQSGSHCRFSRMAAEQFGAGHFTWTAPAHIEVYVADGRAPPNFVRKFDPSKGKDVEYEKLAPHHSFGSNQLWRYIHSSVKGLNLVEQHLPPRDRDVQKMHLGKFVARFQLLFSSTVVGAQVSAKEIEIVPDVVPQPGEGGATDGNGEISPDLADEIAKNLKVLAEEVAAQDEKARRKKEAEADETRGAKNKRSRNAAAADAKPAKRRAVYAPYPDDMPDYAKTPLPELLSDSENDAAEPEDGEAAGMLLDGDGLEMQIGTLKHGIDEDGVLEEKSEEAHGSDSDEESDSEGLDLALEGGFDEQGGDGIGVKLADVPSIHGEVQALQVRIGPARGVLIVDKHLKGRAIRLRSSMVKWGGDSLHSWPSMYGRPLTGSKALIDLEITPHGLVDQAARPPAALNCESILLLEHHIDDREKALKLYQEKARQSVEKACRKLIPACMYEGTTDGEQLKAKAAADQQKAKAAADRTTAMMLSGGVNDGALGDPKSQCARLRFLLQCGFDLDTPSVALSFQNLIKCELLHIAKKRALWCRGSAYFVVQPDPTGVLLPGEFVLRTGRGFLEPGQKLISLKMPCYEPRNMLFGRQANAEKTQQVADRVRCENILVCGSVEGSHGDFDGDKFFVCWDTDVIAALPEWKWESNNDPAATGPGRDVAADENLPPPYCVEILGRTRLPIGDTSIGLRHFRVGDNISADLLNDPAISSADKMRKLFGMALDWSAFPIVRVAEIEPDGRAAENSVQVGDRVITLGSLFFDEGRATSVATLEGSDPNDALIRKVQRRFHRKTKPVAAFVFLPKRYERRYLQVLLNEAGDCGMQVENGKITGVTAGSRADSMGLQTGDRIMVAHDLLREKHSEEFDKRIGPQGRRPLHILVRRALADFPATAREYDVDVSRELPAKWRAAAIDSGDVLVCPDAANGGGAPSNAQTANSAIGSDSGLKMVAAQSAGASGACSSASTCAVQEPWGLASGRDGCGETATGGRIVGNTVFVRNMLSTSSIAENKYAPDEWRALREKVDGFASTFLRNPNAGFFERERFGVGPITNRWKAKAKQLGLEHPATRELASMAHKGANAFKDGIDIRALMVPKHSAANAKRGGAENIGAMKKEPAALGAGDKAVQIVRRLRTKAQKLAFLDGTAEKLRTSGVPDVSVMGLQGQRERAAAGAGGFSGVSLPDMLAGDFAAHLARAYSFPPLPIITMLTDMKSEREDVETDEDEVEKEDFETRCKSAVLEQLNKHRPALEKAARKSLKEYISKRPRQSPAQDAAAWTQWRASVLPTLQEEHAKRVELVTDRLLRDRAGHTTIAAGAFGLFAGGVLLAEAYRQAEQHYGESTLAKLASVGAGTESDGLLQLPDEIHWDAEEDHDHVAVPPLPSSTGRSRHFAGKFKFEAILNPIQFVEEHAKKLKAKAPTEEDAGDASDFSNVWPKISEILQEHEEGTRSAGALAKKLWAAPFEIALEPIGRLAAICRAVQQYENAEQHATNLKALKTKPVAVVYFSQKSVSADFRDGDKDSVQKLAKDITDGRVSVWQVPPLRCVLVREGGLVKVGDEQQKWLSNWDSAIHPNCSRRIFTLDNRRLHAFKLAQEMEPSEAELLIPIVLLNSAALAKLPAAELAEHRERFSTPDGGKGIKLLGTPGRYVQRKRKGVWSYRLEVEEQQVGEGLGSGSGMIWPALAAVASPK